MAAAAAFSPVLGSSSVTGIPACSYLALLRSGVPCMRYRWIGVAQRNPLSTVFSCVRSAAAVTTEPLLVATQPAQKPRKCKGIFYFKEFQLQHGRCAMKMGTDSMLLGAWTQPPSNAQTILDVGTGTGVLALMMAQKTQQQGTIIHAIDIDQDSYLQATENFQESPWGERLVAKHTSLQQWVQRHKRQGNTKYNLIITNPPYYLYSSKPDQSGPALARHADLQLPFDELAAGAATLLQPTGRLCLILPPPEAQRFAMEAAQHGLVMSRLLKVFSKCQDTHPRRLIMQFEPVGSLSASTAGSMALVVPQTGGMEPDTVSVAAATAPAASAAGQHAAVEELILTQQQLDAATNKHVYSMPYRQLTVNFHHPSFFGAGSML